MHKSNPLTTTITPMPVGTGNLLADLAFQWTNHRVVQF